MSQLNPTVIRAQPAGFARRQVGLLLFLGAALLPILSMGVTVPSAVAQRAAAADRAEMQDRLAQREEVFRSLGAYSSDSALDQIEALHESLVSLIPVGVEPLHEFGLVRTTAASLSIDLTSIRAMRTHSTGVSAVGSSGRGDASSGGQSVVVDEVLITMAETIENSLRIVDELRRRGLPTVVLGVDFSRFRPADSNFQAELRLGFVRRVPENNYPRNGSQGAGPETEEALPGDGQ